ncbi:MAG: hypothetical protein HY738_14235 [Bacteroidia bacterium]|nr:hypothetical protein [Bacteroidia bacterium]
MIQLEFNKHYHISTSSMHRIYNCGINYCNLFAENDNYQHFLRLYEKYIEPITETYAWCLMKNRFHLLVKILDEKQIVNLPNLTGLVNLSGLKYGVIQDLSGFENLTGPNAAFVFISKLCYFCSNLTKS